MALIPVNRQPFAPCVSESCCGTFIQYRLPCGTYVGLFLIHPAAESGIRTIT